MGPSDSPPDLSSAIGGEETRGWSGQDAAAELRLSVHMMNESVSHQSDAEQL